MNQPGRFPVRATVCAVLAVSLVTGAGAAAPAHHAAPALTPAKALEQLMQGALTRMASRGRGTDALERALWQANRELCRELGFAFYGGAWGQPLGLVFRPRQRR